MRGDLVSAYADAALGRISDEDIEGEPTLEELKAIGVIIVLEAVGVAFPLKLESLERIAATKTPRPQWLLLSVNPATQQRGEQAVVWVSDDYRAAFLKLFDDYLDDERLTKKGQPKNRALVANINAIRSAVLADLWRSAGAPPTSGTRWWELWLTVTDDGVELLRSYVTVNRLSMAERVLQLGDRTVVWIKSQWADLQGLPFTAVPLAEIRRPEFVDTIEDLPVDDQDVLAGDLAARITAAPATAPAVCHLDTGIRRTHQLLAASVLDADIHSVVGDAGGDRAGHGTAMAGLALFGPLDAPLLSTGTVTLSHRLESVKLLPDPPTTHDPMTYGLVTAQATAAPEATAGRRRVFCLPITDTDVPEADPGVPTLWSATVDALAVGTDIGQANNGIQLIGLPDPDAARLFVVSAGNVEQATFHVDHREVCDLSAVQDPAQAWNALTVGAYTTLAGRPTHPDYAGWSSVAEAGDISPHSRTSVTFSSRWPIKPDICMEGGNVLTNTVDFEPRPSLLSLRTTAVRHDLALDSANATSAATAQAARLGALAMAAYPTYWPETIRGLLVHSAEWTSRMRTDLDQTDKKREKLNLLRRFGWGVPTEHDVLHSTSQAVTMVTQDQFAPFDGPDHKARVFRLHRLPWPVEVLRGLAEADVQLRVTLSYFIEPSASRRGWRRRYAYPSHGLRFELKTPTESVPAFLARMDDNAVIEEAGHPPGGGDSERWLIGPNQRNTGSLHQDVWEGSGAELADCGLIAVTPVGGWWKNNRRKDRQDLPVRYALLVSLRTSEQSVDLYTPIETQLTIPVAAT